MDLMEMKLLALAAWTVFWAVVLGLMIVVSRLLERRARRRAPAAPRADSATPAREPGQRKAA